MEQRTAGVVSARFATGGIHGDEEGPDEVGAPKIDLPALIKKLTTNTDASRMQKVTKMLRADRFQLFAEVTDAHLTGALFTESVKSAALASQSPFMQGAFAGILTELRELDPKDLAARVAAFAASEPSKMVLAGEFLDGAFAVSKTSMLLGAESLVAAIDELLCAAPWEDFMTFLPKVRNAFERLHERQRLSFADRVAARYGLREVKEVAEVKASSAGAAVYMAAVDARVAAIMKEWTF